MRLRRLSQNTIEELAQYMASRLLAKHEGQIDDPVAWQETARRLGIRTRTFHALGAGRGEFCTSLDGEPAAIAINLAYPPLQQARAWIHEITEVLLRRLQPPLLPSEADAGRYEGEPADSQHKVACRVEELVADRVPTRERQ